MKKFILALTMAMAMSAFTINSYSATSFDYKTFILTIPLVEVDDTPTWSDVKLELRSDGLFELVNIEEYTPTPAPENGDYMISQINGEFTGWDGDTIFELTNGQIWKQVGYAFLFHYAFMPEVKITYNNGMFEMEVDNVQVKVQVNRIK
jgi:hypothetical protein